MNATSLQTDTLACPLCGARGAARVFESRNRYSIVRCGGCALVFTDDRGAPPASELYPTFDQSEDGGHQAIRSGLQVFLRQRAAVVRAWKTSGRLLDYGCGNGAFAGRM